MSSWPSTLPDPLAKGYAINPVDQSVRTDMEVGSARMRRRTSARVDKVTLLWTFTEAQMAIFRAWFENASTGAAGGSAWFTVTLNIGTGGTTSCTARFTSGSYKPTVIEVGLWQVTAEVEVR